MPGGSRGGQPYRQYKFHNVFSEKVVGVMGRRKPRGEAMMRGVVKMAARREEEIVKTRVASHLDEGGYQLLHHHQLAVAHRLLQGVAAFEEVGRGNMLEEELVSRRERKPRKDEICQIQAEKNGEDEVKTEVANDRPPSPSPLDLSQPRGASPRSSPPPAAPPPSPSLALVLQPLEYEALAPHHPLYATYIFLPSLGVFVHPLALPPETMVPSAKCTLATFSNNNRVESSSSSSMVPTNKTSSSMVPTNKTEAGGGATFCTFKNVKTVPARKASEDQQKGIL